ncbi:NADPH:quinone oxidoreductase family protein [Pseudomonas sp. RGM2987]|uniref:quinone oxidoreductase family protein n=1 Tax=Pseudomonas sp. RGM2987 TaxID=2930090 RepID=UPI001FD7046F|nr:NADPH:quinone oxidoreductase family protein [Pseudomonas sp. RGM2987]MCJ8208045.1 NADPH:quinone oxidoreductase family protein [Pseudomonas sp. RGM2987]
MKAIQFRRFGGPEVLEYVDLPTPVPGQGEVLIETSAIGVNFPDTRERMGMYNRPETAVGGVALPHITGLQVVGRILEVGEGVDPVVVGRKVMALMPKGAYAQQAIARAEMLVVLDESANDVTMAGLPCQGVTAFLALRTCAHLQPGESVLIQGAAGGVGSLAVQIAKLMGAGTVFGTASTESRRAFVRGLGADYAISYDTAQWPERVLELTQGHGVDVILETVGGEVFDQNFECLAMLGRCVVVGSTRGPGKALPPRRLMAKAHILAGMYLPTFFKRPMLIREALQFLADGASGGVLSPVIGATLPLSEAAQAHTLLARREVQGVIVLDPKR